jgi:hypothetical protein
MRANFSSAATTASYVLPPPFNGRCAVIERFRPVDADGDVKIVIGEETDVVVGAAAWRW